MILSLQGAAVMGLFPLFPKKEGGPVNEVQRVGWTTSAFSVTGTFSLSFSGQTTIALGVAASASEVQTALQSLSTIGAGNVTVELLSTTGANRTYKLTFVGSKAGVDNAQVTINVSNVSTGFFGPPTALNTTDVNGGVFSEMQSLVLANSTGGTWRLAFNGEVTSPLSFNASASQVKTSLDALVSIDNVTVTGSAGSFVVTFGGTQASQNVSQIFGDAATASSGTTTRTISRTYNSSSEVLSLSDPSSTISYNRDNLGRATSISNTIAGLTPTVVLAQAFDSASNRIELKGTIGGVNDFKNSYQFDTLQRLTDIVQQGQAGGNAVTSKHVTISYNGLGQKTNIARYQSTGTTSLVATTDFGYDTANRLSSLTHKQGTTTLSGYTYSYDSVSRLTSVNSTVEGVSLYSYDKTSQLVGADHASQTDETYSFDANGNRNSSGYTTSSNNLTTVGNGFTFTYDDEGNRVSRTETATGKVQEYLWDYRNRLITVRDRNSAGGAIVKQVDYAYDALNRMVRRSLDADGAGAGAATNQYWAYDEGINAVVQFDGAASSNLSHRYLWSNAVDELLADEQVTSLSTGGNTLWGLADHLGTIRDIADANESTGTTSVTNHRTYNAFGKLVAETYTAVDLIFGFTGKQLDDSTGLQHNLFRWYDASLGQWMSEDPMGFGANDGNLRRYIGNSSVGYKDPTGLIQEPNETPEEGTPMFQIGQWSIDKPNLKWEPLDTDLKLTGSIAAEIENELGFKHVFENSFSFNLFAGKPELEQKYKLLYEKFFEVSVATTYDMERLDFKEMEFSYNQSSVPIRQLFPFLPYRGNATVDFNGGVRLDGEWELVLPIKTTIKW